MYKPQAKNEEKISVEKLSEMAKIVPSVILSRKESAAKKASKAQEKKKSNLELFKEELRQ